MPTTSPSRRRPVAASRATVRRPAPPAVTVGRATLTGRAAVLALVLAALVLSLALPLREYLAQRGRIDELRTRGDATQARIDELAAAQLRWSDPAYVAAQARQRLHFVMPGEVGYVVLGPEEAPAPGSPAAAPSERPWYASLWGTLERAGRAPAPTTAPAPAAAPSSAPKPSAPAPKPSAPAPTAPAR